MNLRLAKLFLIAIPVLLTAFSWPNKPGSGGNPKLLANKSLSTPETILTFKDFQIISVKNNEVQLKAITDNAGVKQVTNITVNIDGENLSFAIVVLPNDRNVELKYRANIKPWYGSNIFGIWVQYFNTFEKSFLFSHFYYFLSH